MPISKPFVIATEGRTVDGRNIPREWLTQAAENYDPAAYTAVVNLEHYLAFSAESEFSAQGKVLSLSTQTAKILGQDRLQLTAVAEVSDEAAKLQAGGKKGFASIEIIPNFSDTGKAYLTGLALTDSPAALGTQAMKFCRGDHPLGDASECLALAQETGMEFAVGVEPDVAPESGGLIEALRSLLTGKPKAEVTPTPAAESDVAARVAAESAAATQRLTDRLAKVEAELLAESANLDKLKATHAAMNAAIGEVVAALSELPAAPARPFATGGDATAKTDC